MKKKRRITKLIQFLNFSSLISIPLTEMLTPNKKKMFRKFNDDELMYSLKKINVVCHVSRSFISHSLGIIFPSFQSHLRACHSELLVLCE
jgi:hypothetical protein